MAGRAQGVVVQRLRTNHRGFVVFVVHEFLDRADVLASFQKVGCDCMTARVSRRGDDPRGWGTVLPRQEESAPSPNGLGPSASPTLRCSCRSRQVARCPALWTTPRQYSAPENGGCVSRPGAAGLLKITEVRCQRSVVGEHGRVWGLRQRDEDSCLFWWNEPYRSRRSTKIVSTASRSASSKGSGCRC